ncbi:MAG: DUF3017 domain-containing protein [Actinomycetales bacterium]|nr:DUF3017 domain-containing protein [Actinomycetales bacterium]
MTPTQPAPARTHAVMWMALAGVAAALVVAFTWGARPASVLLAVELLVLAFVRAVAPPPGPYGISARSRGFDVAFLFLGGAAMVVLALTADNI